MNISKYLVPTSQNKKAKPEQEALDQLDSSLTEFQKLFEESFGNGNLTRRNKESEP